MIRALAPAALVLALALAACGQKGPLRVPEPAPAPPETGKPAAP